MSPAAPGPDDGPAAPGTPPRAHARGEPDVDVLNELEGVLRARAQDAPRGSYSATLLGDPQLATRKIMEEAFEVCWELGRPDVDRSRAASEAADLIFHVIAGLVGAGIPLVRVWEELARRRTPDPSGTAGPTAEDRR